MEQEAKHAGGRPTKYEANYHVERAYGLALLGLDDSEMAKVWEVDVSTVSNWKNDHPEFLEALRQGKDEADQQIVKSLYHRARGYEHPEVDVKMYNGEIIMTDLVKHYPPDTAAAIFWLKNRQRDKWRDKQEIETDLKSSDGSMTPKGTVDKSQLDDIIASLKDKTAKEAE